MAVHFNISDSPLNCTNSCDWNISNKIRKTWETETPTVETKELMMVDASTQTADFGTKGKETWSETTTDEYGMTTKVTTTVKRKVMLTPVTKQPRRGDIINLME